MRKYKINLLSASNERVWREPFSQALYEADLNLITHDVLANKQDFYTIIKGSINKAHTEPCLSTYRIHEPGSFRLIWLIKHF